MAAPRLLSVSRATSGGIAIVVALLAAVAPATATTLIRMEELPALVEESRRAVLAEVIEVRYGKDDQDLHSTWLTLRVEDPLYGDDLPAAGDELTVKIYGAPLTMPDGTRVFIEGTPLYRTGERYFLLLREDSSHGFTNVPGLYQGAFRASPALGDTTVQSLSGNRRVFGEGGLVTWLDGAALTDGERSILGDSDAAVPYALLRQAVMRLWTDAGGVAWKAVDGEGAAQ